MNAGKININGIFNGARKLEVPFYQRAYVWGEEQWERLLDDLAFITATNRPYFIGSIILKKGVINTWDVASDKKIVVDGQQRLTTLMLFYKALCLLSGTVDKFDATFRLEDESLALSLGMIDEDAFDKAINQDKPSEIQDYKARSNIIDAFNYFIRNIKPDKYSRIKINQNLQFVCIDLDEDEDEQQVFDTINSLGVRLTTAELLKNYFYSKEDIKEYKKNWVGVFEKDDDIRAYWSQEFETGRITRTMIDVFFDSYFQLYVQDSVYKVNAEDKMVYGRLDRLALSYQDFIKDYCNGEKQVILAPMSKYAEIFRQIFDPNCLKRHMSKEAGLDRINVIIFGLKTTTLIPYVLYLAANVDDKDEFRSMLAVLESYVMRRIVTKQNSKNYNKLFVSLILNKVLTTDDLLLALKRNNDSTMAVPSDAALKTAFETSRLTNLQAKGIIYFIEAAIRTDKSSTALLGFDQYSLEHLMPRKWRNHWSPCESAEMERKRDFKLATLGNFAIITQALNTSISDSDWKTKKEGKNGNPGLETCASGLLTMESVLSEETWDETKIEQRASWLYEKAKEIWSAVVPAVDSEGFHSEVSDQSIKQVRKQYYKYALPFIQESTAYRGAFVNVNPTSTYDLVGYTGTPGGKIICGVYEEHACVYLYLGSSDKEKNKSDFDALLSHKEEIEEAIGGALVWDRANDKKASWIVYRLQGVSAFDESAWPQIAKFHAEYCKKMLDIFVPYLDDQDDTRNRIIDVAGWLREWVVQKENTQLVLSKCSPSYTRFLTGDMSALLPVFPGVVSDWGTEDHYYYEIHYISFKRIQLQLAINSKDIPEKFQRRCEIINSFYPCVKDINNWSYMLPFKTKVFNVDDTTTKDEVFTYLNSCYHQLKTFELSLKEKLDDPASMMLD